jgi:hypothetical protein
MWIRREAHDNGETLQRRASVFCLLTVIAAVTVLGLEHYSRGFALINTAV